MSENILVAIITGAIALMGSIISSNKIKSLILYRLELLERKQDKHNSLIERMYKVEQSVKSAHHRIDEMK